MGKERDGKEFVRFEKVFRGAWKIAKEKGVKKKDVGEEIRKVRETDKF